MCAALLIGGYGTFSALDQRSGQETSSPPAGAQDPLNRGILIEAGVFMMGTNEVGAMDGPHSTKDERPMRRREVEAFWIQEHAVTNQEFQRFDEGHDFPAGLERHPVVDVTWEQAMAYARSIGGVLPTEVQWEYAARGTKSRRYPWGDAEPTCDLAHYRECEPRSTIEVMARPAGATPEGVHGLAGNVWEWVTPIWFKPGSTPVNIESRRSRGGSFVGDAFFLRASNRNNDFYAGFSDASTGFRVVWPVEG